LKTKTADATKQAQKALDKAAKAGVIKRTPPPENCPD